MNTAFITYNAELVELVHVQDTRSAADFRHVQEKAANPKTENKYIFYFSNKIIIYYVKRN